MYFISNVHISATCLSSICVSFIHISYTYIYSMFCSYHYLHCLIFKLAMSTPNVYSLFYI